MFQIQNTLVQRDVIEEEFCCNLECCRGCCCIEGDAGAPITKQEDEQIRALLPSLLSLMTPEARAVVAEKGVSYTDPDGDLVTQLVNGRECVFCRTDHSGWSYCVIERLFRDGKSSFRKPISCYLAPIRLKEYATFTAVEYHRWDICHSARQQGKHLHIPLYKFLREPLIQRFGEDWYNELCLVAEEWKKQCKQK